jgi:hypothetical protein
MGQNSQGDRSADEQDQKDEAAPDCIMSPIERDPAKDCLHSPNRSPAVHTGFRSWFWVLIPQPSND